MKGCFSLHLWAIHYSRGPPKSFVVCLTPKSNNHSLYYVLFFPLLLLTLYFLKYEKTEFDRLDTILCGGFFVCVCFGCDIFGPEHKKYTHTKDKFPTSDFILLLGVISFYLQIHFRNKTKKIETKIACKYSFFKKTPKGAFTYDVWFLGR